MLTHLRATAPARGARRGARPELSGPRHLVAALGGSFAEMLGIDLVKGRPQDVYQWFLAAILYGARISETVASATYGEFARAGVLSARAVMRTGWDGLVKILDRGGYVRYDFKTATKLLEINEALLRAHGGNLNALHAAARDPDDLERRLMALGTGIGEVTAGIFLRELRGIWPKAQPLPSELVLKAARDLGYLPGALREPRAALVALQKRWQRAGMPANTFREFEAALVRHGIALRRRAARARH